MITTNTIDSVVDVMLLAIARQMVVEHTSPLENLTMVVAVGILFVSRKYLYVSYLDNRRRRREAQEAAAIRTAVFGSAEKEEPQDAKPEQ